MSHATIEHSHKRNHADRIWRLGGVGGGIRSQDLNR